MANLTIRFYSNCLRRHTTFKMYLPNDVREGTPVEETINNASDLIDFQKIVKLSGKYDYVSHNNKEYRNKCYRVFASTRESDDTIYKVKIRIK